MAELIEAKAVDQVHCDRDYPDKITCRLPTTKRLANISYLLDLESKPCIAGILHLTNPNTIRHCSIIRPGISKTRVLVKRIRLTGRFGGYGYTRDDYKGVHTYRT